MNALAAGSIAGLVATVPMTAVMEGLYRQLPPKEQYPLPPREITQSVTEAAGVEDQLDEEEHVKLALGSHFAYGTACGAAYALTAYKLPIPALVSGAAFGMSVWAGSYLGWLPAMGILKPATEHPPRRNGLMIAAHVVWGLAAGMMVAALDGERTRERMSKDE